MHVLSSTFCIHIPLCKFRVPKYLILGGLEPDKPMRFENVVINASSNNTVDLFVDERAAGNAILYPNFIAISTL